MVLEPGCGMGYFTLPLARMVGPQGRVVALEIQPKMLSVLERRARKSGLLDRIELRQIGTEGLSLEDFSGQMDFTAALHMVHEVPDQSLLFTEILRALKPGGKFLVVEPKGHVSQDQFEKTVSAAEEIGFKSENLTIKIGGRVALLARPDT